MQVGDKVYVEDVSLAWGNFTGELTVLATFQNNQGVELLNLGMGETEVVSGLPVDRCRSGEESK